MRETRKSIVAIVLVISLLPLNFVFAQDTTDPDSTAGSVVAENGVSSESSSSTESPEPLNNDGGDETSQDLGSNDGASSEEGKPEGIAIDENNFPDTTLRETIKGVDNGDGILTDEENSNITSFYIADYEGRTEFNLAGIEKLKNINEIYISTEIHGKKISIINIENLGKLPNLQGLSLKNVNLPKEFGNVSLPKLINLYSYDTELDLKSYNGMPELLNMNVTALSKESLMSIDKLPKLETLSLSNGWNVKSFDDLKSHSNLQNLYISKSNIGTLAGISRFPRLSRLSIEGGSIDNIGNISNEAPETLKNINIQDQSVESNRGYKVGQPYKVDRVNLGELSNRGNLNINPTGDGEFTDDGIVWNERILNSYSISYNDNIDDRYIRYNGKVNNIYPIDYENGEWIKAVVRSSFVETFVKDNKLVKTIRTLANGTGENHDSLFANKLVVDGKEYTYSYSYGNDSTAKIYYIDRNLDEITDIQISPENTTRYIKRDGNNFVLKTVSEYDINGKKLKKEEISYIKDGGIRHDVTYTNLSDEPINNIEIYQMLDTMLNEDDTVPIYADGKGNAYIYATDFTLYLQKIGEVGNIISGQYAQGPIDESAKKAEEYKRGDVLLRDLDTAIYYGTGLMNLEPNQSHTYSYSETIYTEIPTIKVQDKTINVNENWDVNEHLIGIYNQEGEELSKDKLEIIHNVDTSVAGEYEITFVYNKVYSANAKLTVIGKTENEETISTPKIEKKKVDTVKTFNKNMVKTGDNTNIIVIASLLLASVIGVLILFKRKK